MQDEQYFIRRRGRVTGPYDYDTVKKMVQTGKLYKSDELSLDQVDWVTASETEFFPEKVQTKKVNPNPDEVPDDDYQPGPSPVSGNPPPQTLWYYALNDQQLGPIKEIELKQQFQLKTIGPKTKVWCEGMSTWEDADKNNVFRDYFFVAPVANGGIGISGFDRFCENCGNKVEPRAFMCMKCGSRLKKGGESQEGGSRNGNGELLDHTELATIGQRFIAHVIDGFILAFIAILEGFVLFLPPIVITFAGNEAVAALAYMISSVLFFVVYFATFIYYDAYLISTEKMATPGKAMFNLAVCREDGSRLTFGLAIGRLFVKSVLSPILLIGYLLAIFNNKHQALHDMMVGSLVVQQK